MEGVRAEVTIALSLCRVHRILDGGDFSASVAKTPIGEEIIQIIGLPANIGVQAAPQPMLYCRQPFQTEREGPTSGCMYVLSVSATGEYRLVGLTWLYSKISKRSFHTP